MNSEQSVGCIPKVWFSEALLQRPATMFACLQVIKYKLCRCSNKKHKRSNSNDRGAVLSLEDVKRHVSRLALSLAKYLQCLEELLDRDRVGGLGGR